MYHEDLYVLSNASDIKKIHVRIFTQEKLSAADRARLVNEKYNVVLKEVHETLHGNVEIID